MYKLEIANGYKVIELRYNDIVSAAMLIDDISRHTEDSLEFKITFEEKEKCDEFI